MKKTGFVLALAAFMLATLTGCVSTKKIVYFQGADTVYSQARRIMQQYELRLKPSDQVLIKVSCPDPELLGVFSQDVIMGTAGTNSNITNYASGGVSNAYGYTVNNQGEVKLPALGNVKVMGLTTEEAARHIEDKIKEAHLIGQPEVTVRLLNARVSVLGAVQRPGVVSLTSERNSVLDVISQCSDIDDTGLRYKVQLYREENGERVMYDLDLTKADIFNSPAYYVQQNDIIYVQPNKSKSVKSSAFYTFLSAAASVVALISTAVSLTILITRR